jgi:hypothetical protein
MRGEREKWCYEIERPYVPAPVVNSKCGLHFPVLFTKIMLYTILRIPQDYFAYLRGYAYPRLKTTGLNKTAKTGWGYYGLGFGKTPLSAVKIISPFTSTLALALAGQRVVPIL